MDEQRIRRMINAAVEAALQSLDVRCRIESDYGDRVLRVELLSEGEVIASDYVTLSSLQEG